MHNNIRGNWDVNLAKKPVRDEQTCEGIANLKIIGFTGFFKDFIGLKI